MELKMLLSAQRRLRERTQRLAGLGLLDPDPKEKVKDQDQPDAQPEAAVDAAAKARAEREAVLRGQADEVSRAEEALAELMKALIAKYPVIDLALLGAENEQLEEEQVKIPLIRGPPEGESSKEDGPESKDQGQDERNLESESPEPDSKARKE
jgi:hypothetical protein